MGLLLLLVIGLSFWFSVLSKPNYYNILGQSSKPENVILRFDDNQVVDIKTLEAKKKMMGYVDIDLVLGDIVEKYKDKVFGEENTSSLKQEFKNIAEWEEYVYNQKYSRGRKFKDDIIVESRLSNEEKTGLLFSSQPHVSIKKIQQAQQSTPDHTEFSEEEQRTISAFLNMYPSLTKQIKLGEFKTITLKEQKLSRLYKQDTTLKKINIPQVYVTRYKLSKEQLQSKLDVKIDAYKEKKFEEYRKDVLRHKNIKITCLDVYQADFCTKTTDKF